MMRPKRRYWTYPETRKYPQTQKNELADDIIDDFQEIIKNFQITENVHRRRQQQFENMLVTALTKGLFTVNSVNVGK